MPTPKTMLARYRIDRADGATATGPEKLIVLCLRGNDTPELGYVISKTDAMLIGLALQSAATEIQADDNLRA